MVSLHGRAARKRILVFRSPQKGPSAADQLQSAFEKMMSRRQRAARKKLNRFKSNGLIISNGKSACSYYYIRPNIIG